MKHSFESLHFLVKLGLKIISPFLKYLNLLKDTADLIARVWIAKIFFFSFLSKITDWGATMVLFTYDYSVPILSPAIAAYLGTAAELILPICLVLGLGGRFLIFIFFVYNIVCVVSFHFLWTARGAVGLDDHINWGILLMLLMFHGSGRFSLDYLLHQKFGHFLHHNKESV